LLISGLIMPVSRKYPTAFALAFVLVVISNPIAFAQTESAQGDFSSQRAKDTHAFDLIPVFDIPGDSPSQTVEKNAQRQIENSIHSDADSAIAPTQSPSKVMFSNTQKMNAAKESTNVGSDSPGDAGQIHKDSKDKRPTLALALGGGGARGAAHIGVLRVFEREHIPIDYIVGNSMGSIVGGLYASGVSLDDIQKIMTDGSLRKAYMPGRIPPKLLLSPIEKLMHPRKKHYAGLWTGKKFGDFLAKQLPKNVCNVEDTPLPFSAVATNLLDGKAYRISNGKLSTAIRASSTIPMLLQPVAIGDKVYIDGGVRANLPASAARDTGADLVIAVLVDEPLRILPAKRFRHMSAIAQRLTDVMLAVADGRQLPFADIIITPDVSSLPVMTARPEDARKAILAGEQAALKAIPEIRKRLNTPVNRAALIHNAASGKNN
ncbi:MAG: patatin-like phospholipase family protein, partial [Candidatus Obscuribacterales bacterium]|nr:patatin-like phospholipase family protein [Candidatus Obscuribacterales bacterium]